MKLKHLAFWTFALLFANVAFAGTLDVYCELTKSGDYGSYYGFAHYNFGGGEPTNGVYVGMSSSVSGTDNFDQDGVGGYVNTSNPYLENAFSFPLAPGGGCDYASIYAQCYYATPESEYYQTPSPLCYANTKCYLSVAMNSGGYLSGTSESGWYDCYACVTLAAYPYSGWNFDGWSGDVSSDQPVITVCMNNRDRSETAYFSQADPPAPGGGPDTPPPNGDPTDKNGAVSPIIISFEPGSRYKLTGSDAPVLFDIAANGAPHKIGWTEAGADEAFLWLDRNGNGVADNGAELFGNATPLKNGVRAANGFVALAEFDDNGDHVIDAHDAVWSALRLWRDVNHDGVCQPSEVSALALSGLTAIGIDHHWTGRIDSSGNVFRYEGKFWSGRASSPKPLYDIFFVRID
jgi:hypothetical protein